MRSQLTFLATMLLLSQSPALAADKGGKSLAKGKEVYTQNCLTCHGEKGAGDGPAGQYLNPRPRNLATDSYKNGDSKEKIMETLEKGLKGTAMASFAHIPAKDREAVAEYLLSWRKEHAAAAKSGNTKK